MDSSETRWSRLSCQNSTTMKNTAAAKNQTSHEVKMTTFSALNAARMHVKTMGNRTAIAMEPTLRRGYSARNRSMRPLMAVRYSSRLASVRMIWERR